MKKTYITPMTEVVILKTKSGILAGSKLEYSNETMSSGSIDSRDFSGFDDEE